MHRNVSSELVDEQLRTLDIKMGQLKREYEQYFLGTRPREPSMLRGEVQKLVIVLTNQPIQNTGLRFRFSSLCSKFQALRRQWDDILRKIEQGTYERHQFKARIRTGGGASSSPRPGAPEKASADDVFQSYVDARLACGQDVKGMTRDKIDGVIARQRAQLSEKYGSDASFQFRVAVEDGKAKLKAIRER
jgi:hypothetical protein